jgi:hypothetical protein
MALRVSRVVGRTLPTVVPSQAPHRGSICQRPRIEIVCRASENSCFQYCQFPGYGYKLRFEGETVEQVLQAAILAVSNQLDLHASGEQVLDEAQSSDTKNREDIYARALLERDKDRVPSLIMEAERAIVECAR